MDTLKEYFQTNWSAMTIQDWLGLIITVAVFIAMVVLYVYVFHPSNREKLEKHRLIPMEDDKREQENSR
ncbi:MAG: cbb3-type cytochrome c oxidase subunit 3 [Gammaproteobacteria bacterium]|jgi:cytochrome c oxidase cbb3-type subunit 4